MTPKEPSGGRATGSSFKGAFMYYTHDKRSEGEDMRLSDDRVDWMEYRNLATDDPHLASSIMAATAANQSSLKQQAGVPLPKKGESDQVVYHYSLAWHPSEKDGLTKSEMMRAANESIRALGAEHCQAAFIAHNDTDHPHVHVVVNRVSPETGELLNLWQSQKRLSKWAMSYEQERGKVFCGERVENWNKRAQGQTVYADKGASYQSHGQAEGLGHANDNDTAKLKAEQKAKDADLAAYGQKMHSRHSAEWKAYSRDYQDSKAHILKPNGDRPTPFQQAAADVKAQFKPLRSHLGKQQWRETKDFEKRETRILGKLENAIAAVRYAHALGREESKGYRASLFNFLTSSKSRKDALERLHKVQWRRLNAGQSAEVGAAIAKVKTDQQATLTAHRQRFSNKRQLLKDTQDGEKADLQRKWKTRKSERLRTYDVIRKQEVLKKEQKAAPELTRGQQRAAFNQAARGGRKRKGRVRKRDKD
jgi:hypothetical protein